MRAPCPPRPLCPDPGRRSRLAAAHSARARPQGVARPRCDPHRRPARCDAACDRRRLPAGRPCHRSPRCSLADRGGDDRLRRRLRRSGPALGELRRADHLPDRLRRRLRIHLDLRPHLADRRLGHRAPRRTLSITIALAGISSFLGPGFAGLLAERTGPGLPFTLAGVALLVLAVVLAGPAHSAERGTVEHTPLRSSIGRAARSPVAVAGLVTMTAGGLAMSAINLLVPLDLSAGGIGSAGIGAVYAAAACFFTLTSFVSARLGDRIASALLGGITLLGLASLTLLPIARDDTPRRSSPSSSPARPSPPCFSHRRSRSPSSAPTRSASAAAR